MELTGATVLVTGGGKRLGAALAAMMARQGANVAIHHHHSHEEAQALVEALQGETAAAGRPARLTALAADLADPIQAAELLDRARERLGPVSVLLNSAAIFEPGTVRESSLDHWNRHLALNLTAPFLLMQAFARQPEMTDPAGGAGTRGVVINGLDERILHPRPGHLAYTVAKEGLWSLTRLAAQELAPTIRVNAVAPGPILPAPDDPDGVRFAKVAAAVPLGRGGTPEEVVAAVLFLLQHDYLTGQMICVDGGRHLT
ncbi:MAG: SDR family oxidoreductase [Magnetococcales bacterium]|nr:SDR family oxidoreductase [Magnetococcales bacterium]